MILVLQPALPRYRRPFFELLSERYGNLFRVYSSEPGNAFEIDKSDNPVWHTRIGRVITVFPGLNWQVGVSRIQLQRNDILVLWGAPRCISNLYLLLYARCKLAKIVWWGHDWSASSRPWSAKLRRKIFPCCDALLFYTDRELRQYYERTRRGRRCAFSLNNGVDLRTIRVHRADWIVDNTRNSLLFVGRLSDKARFDLLLNALPELSDLDIHLEVIGTGAGLIEYQRKAISLGVSNRVRWHGELTAEEEIAKIANRCFVFVYPGAVGLSLIHAMGYGLPAVVHSDISRHMPEISAFREGITGLSFRFGVVSDLAEKVRRLFFDPQSLSRMSLAARQEVDKNYNVEGMAERFVSMIDTIGTCAKFNRGGS